MLQLVLFKIDILVILCDFKKIIVLPLNLINVPKNDSIFLQNAQAKVRLVDERICHTFRTLFDSGTQLSYISPQAAKNLNLKPIEKKDIVVKIFGNVKALKELDMVEFAR